jgi:hypothetical protein
MGDAPGRFKRGPEASLRRTVDSPRRLPHPPATHAKRRPRVNVLLVPVGSHGDVHPFCGIGADCCAAGTASRW